MYPPYLDIKWQRSDKALWRLALLAKCYKSENIREATNFVMLEITEYVCSLDPSENYGKPFCDALLTLIKARLKYGTLVIIDDQVFNIVQLADNAIYKLYSSQDTEQMRFAARVLRLVLAVDCPKQWCGFMQKLVEFLLPIISEYPEFDLYVSAIILNIFRECPMIAQDTL